MLSELASLGAEATSQGLLDSSRAVGGITGPLVAGLMVRWIGFQGMFVGMAASSLVGLGVGILSMTIWPRRVSQAGS